MMWTRSLSLAAALGLTVAAPGCKKAAPDGGEAPPAPAEPAETAAAPAPEAPAAATAPDGEAEAPPAAQLAVQGTAGDTDAELADALTKVAGSDTLVGVGANGKTRVYAAGQTPLADTDTYSIRVALPDGAAAGQSSKATVHVSPKPGWKLNKDFPTKLSVTAPEGVSVAKATQSAKDAAKFEEKAAAFEIDFTPSSAGAKQFTADFRFAVCTESTCDPKKQKLAFSVDVK